MRQRLLTAGIGLPILILVLIFHQTLLMDIAVAVVSVMGVYEILVATKYSEYLSVTLLCLIFAGCLPFVRRQFGLTTFGYIAVPVFLLLMALITLRHYHTVKLEQICVPLSLSVLIPFSFSTLLYMRYDSTGNGLFYIMITFACAWLSDAGAYFVGRAFGKHKLAPEISPKKTVEGAIGGAVFNVICCLLVGLIYAAIRSGEHRLSYLLLILVGIIGALLAILGDLLASFVKRQRGIKDFGDILPGHGGILDRFDSVLLVAPFIYMVQQVFPLIS